MPSQYPLSGWTPGAVLANYRQIVFDNYVFPLTAQETDKTSKLAVQTQPKMPFNPGGDYIPTSTTLNGREVNIVADIGTGMIGSAGNTLLTADDLEAERCLLAGLQTLGRQKLWTRPDKYLVAYLQEFKFEWFQDGGAYRYATFTCKFFADDPRFYSANLTTLNFNGGSAITTTGVQYLTCATLGNTRAWPTFTINGACKGPTIGIHDPTQNPPGGPGYTLIEITFANLTMGAGDTLVVACDPRPEARRICAQYTPSGSVAQQALGYINPATGFSNTKDSSTFFPMLEPNNPGYQALVQASGGGTPNYTASISWQDMWI